MNWYKNLPCKKTGLSCASLQFFLSPWMLLIVAVCYYGAYYRCGLYPSGEGGVEGVTALRLLSGKIPIVDVALNYNLLWFYPIVWLFKIFGASYTVLRIFFFSLATLSGLLAFQIVQATTQRRALAFLAGILALVLPGQLFRNYMAFIVLLNMAIFLKAFLLPYRSIGCRFLWMAASGLSLGLAFLLRLDLGFFLTIILLGLILLMPWSDSLQELSYPSLKRRFLMSITAFFLALVGFTALHFPVYYNATQRGFASQFLVQYQQWPHMIVAQGTHLLQEACSTIVPKTQHPLNKQQHPPSPPFHQNHAPPTVKQSNLIRRSFTSPDIRERLMALTLYLPIPCSLLLGMMACVFLFLGRKSNNTHYAHHSLVLLTCLGCSLTLFPQYFFWRPDMVHLSEFMVPMTITLLIGMAFAWEAYSWEQTRNFDSSQEPLNPPSKVCRLPIMVLRIILCLFACFATADLLLYYISGCQSQSTGGIAISQGRVKEFTGANGVHVKLTPLEFQEATAIYQSVINHSQPGDYLLCYPYNPEINFMTDRPSYRRDLYIDDMTAPKDFNETAIAEIEKYQPPVIVITDWPINGTDHSRFSHWAAKTYYYIQTHYRTDYRQGIIHVFVRPDKKD